MIYFELTKHFIKKIKKNIRIIISDNSDALAFCEQPYLLYLIVGGAGFEPAKSSRKIFTSRNVNPFVHFGRAVLLWKPPKCLLQELVYLLERLSFRFDDAKVRHSLILEKKSEENFLIFLKNISNYVFQDTLSEVMIIFPC